MTLRIVIRATAGGFHASATGLPAGSVSKSGPAEAVIAEAAAWIADYVAACSVPPRELADLAAGHARVQAALGEREPRTTFDMPGGGKLVVRPGLEGVVAAALATVRGRKR